MTVLALDVLLLSPLRHLLLGARRVRGHTLHKGLDTLIHNLMRVVVGSRISLRVGEVLGHDMLVLFRFCQTLLKMTSMGCQI